MLPPFIIEQIRKRESEENSRHEQLPLQLPLDHPRPRPAREVPDEEAKRGVVILEL